MPDQSMKDIKKEIYLLIHKAEQMLELTEDAFMKNKAASLDQSCVLCPRDQGQGGCAHREARQGRSGRSGEARAILSVPMHIEKIAISIERIAENVRVKIKEGLLFSDKAIQDKDKFF